MTPPKTKRKAKRKSPSFRADWPKVLEVGAAIVRAKTDEYGEPPDLKTCFYELFSLGHLPNRANAYKGLSRESAEARRAGWVPPLLDETRTITRRRSFAPSCTRALDWLKKTVETDHTASQRFRVYIATEKRGLVAPIEHWFYKENIPILPLGGYASQTLVDNVRKEIATTAVRRSSSSSATSIRPASTFRATSSTALASRRSIRSSASR